MEKNEIVVYQTRTGEIHINVDNNKETLLLTQQQVARIFDVQKAAISKHIKNIFETDELDKKATVSKKETVQKESNRAVVRNIEYYNLDLVLSIGYRVNSKKATLFRQWATRTLRSHIVDGYTINRSRIAKNYENFIEAVEKVKLLLPASGLVDAGSALELIKLFADTWVSLHSYDTSALPIVGITKKQVLITAEELSRELDLLKQSQTDASELFGAEREHGSVAGVIGNVFQSFGGKDLYPSIEEKAAHLLYFIVKNHAFIDGNKRSGAFAFIWFLRKARLLDTSKMTPVALTALTLLVAESDPAHKENIIGLILLLLKK